MTPEEQIKDLERKLAEGNCTLAEIEVKREALAQFMNWARSNEAELKAWLAKVSSYKNN